MGVPSLTRSAKPSPSTRKRQRMGQAQFQHLFHAPTAFSRLFARQAQSFFSLSFSRSHFPPSPIPSSVSSLHAGGAWTCTKTTDASGVRIQRPKRGVRGGKLCVNARRRRRRLKRDGPGNGRGPAADADQLAVPTAYLPPRPRPPTKVFVLAGRVPIQRGTEAPYLLSKPDPNTERRDFGLTSGNRELPPGRVWPSPPFPRLSSDPARLPTESEAVSNSCRCGKLGKGPDRTQAEGLKERRLTVSDRWNRFDGNEGSLRPLSARSDRLRRGRSLTGSAVIGGHRRGTASVRRSTAWEQLGPAGIVKHKVSCPTGLAGSSACSGSASVQSTDPALGLPTPSLQTRNPIAHRPFHAGRPTDRLRFCFAYRPGFLLPPFWHRSTAGAGWALGKDRLDSQAPLKRRPRPRFGSSPSSRRPPWLRLRSTLAQARASRPRATSPSPAHRPASRPSRYRPRAKRPRTKKSRRPTTPTSPRPRPRSLRLPPSEGLDRLRLAGRRLPRLSLPSPSTPTARFPPSTTISPSLRPPTRASSPHGGHRPVADGQPNRPAAA